jgi:glutamate racemase
MDHQASQPIGIFDSGIGGLTVANAIIRALPEEEIIYFGDTAHLPYGEKSADAIRYYSLRIAKFLLERHCKMVVIACNSASTAAYRVLLDFFKAQALFVNVVDPLVDAVAQRTFRRVGVIATKATVQSGVYEQQLRQLKPDLEVRSLATPLLAPMIEEGFVNNDISQVVLGSYLGDPHLEGIEALLLACTHYPLIKSAIEDYYRHRIEIFDSTDLVANEVRQKLAVHQLLNERRRHAHQFYVSDYTATFEQATRVFYKEEIHLEHYPMW